MALIATEQERSLAALLDDESVYEIHRGRPREKPSMSYQHGYLSFELGYEIRRQIDPAKYTMRVNHGRVRRTEETYYIPDVMVIPMSLVGPERYRSDVLEIYDAPLPLVVEVWSPSTGDYDVEEKLPEYQLRGDYEIWRLHPFERTLTAWRRQPDGSYAQVQFTGGRVQLWALPEITIDLTALFGSP